MVEGELAGSGAVRFQDASGAMDPPRGSTESGRSPHRAAISFWLNALFNCTIHFPWVVRVTRPLVLFFAWSCSRTLRDGPLTNARRLLGPGSTRGEQVALGKAVVRDFYDFVCEIGVTLRLSRQQMRERIEGVEGHQRYVEVRREKRGAVLVTAHLGSFELGVAALADIEPQIHIVYDRDVFDRFERLRSGQRQRLGVYEARLRDGISMWGRLRDALREDHVVLIQGDRTPPGHRGVAMPFMGGHLLMPTGPVKLAIASGAPIVPTVSVRSASGKVTIYLGDPMDVDKHPHIIDDTHPVMIRLAEFFERYVRRFPDQWHVLQRAWCEDRIDPS